ncbi:MOB kinase activator-like 4 [Schistosoma japonicum]|nr:MOB kinase activator-like 4 [Schistosoma japonicum]
MATNKVYFRRNRPGTKAEEWCNWPDEPFEDMESTLAVQQTIRRDFNNVDEILTAPEGQDEVVWKYEHLRQFCMELNGLAVRLQLECTPKTCPQMTATDQWIFLCAAHKTPKECPAVDYTRHTLDGAACLLNSSKYFPSRVSIKVTSVNRLDSVCRRVYRIFSHAYYHHREIFDAFEDSTALCKRFTTFVLKYNLMSKDNLIVPIPGAVDGARLYSNQTSRTPLTNYVPLIGLEIHAQLSVQNKLFTPVPYRYGAPPNTLLGLHDVAMPGSMPILNRQCLELALIASIGLNCKINLMSRFDRKHYFYADLPAGYQITQYYQPISNNGYLDYIWLRNSSNINQIHPLHTNIIQCINGQYYYHSHARIKCIQIEQDSGKSLHNLQRNCSLIDLNRSDVGLIEIVTEPDFNSSDQTAAFITDLSRLLKYLKCCNSVGAFGELRVDVNVSIGSDLANQNPRVEIKNINTIHGVTSSIDYEIKRQSEILMSGGQINQETRCYDPVNNVTLRMRDKELAQDYRYIPEPNLPAVKLLSTCSLCSSQSSSITTSHLSSIPLSKNHICIQCVKQKYQLDSMNWQMNLPQYKKQKLLLEHDYQWIVLLY